MSEFKQASLHAVVGRDRKLVMGMGGDPISKYIKNNESQVLTVSEGFYS